VTADLVAETRALLGAVPDTNGSGRTQVMELLATFQADPCASGWYGFVVRLGLLVEPDDVRGLVGELDPYPGVTRLALADASTARDAATGRDEAAGHTPR
jgi:hypothetical protein